MTMLAVGGKRSGCRRPNIDNDVFVCLHLFAPLPQSVYLHLPSHTTCEEILEALGQALPGAARHLYLTTRGGRLFAPSMRLSDIHMNPCTEIVARIRCMGGKGGFGNMLRAQGGRMSARGKHESQDSYRDLEGRRLGSINEAKLLAEYIAKAPERQAALDEAQKRKYAKLEKMLGRTPKSMADFQEAAEMLDDAGDSLEADPEPLGKRPESSQTVTKRKERLDDHEYVEQSREIVDNVRSAVASAMKKRKGKKRAVAPPVADQPEPVS